MDRREFVVAAAGAVAAGLGLRAWARPGGWRGAPFGIGMVGMGLRAREIFNGYLKANPRARVVAIAEVDQTRREHGVAMVNEAYGDESCAAFVADAELLALPGVDAVVIATPDHWHATQCLAAIRAGKDVYCEKPLTHTLLEGKLLIEAVRAKGTVFQTGSQQRSEYGHRFVDAVEAVRNGRIGRVLNINIGVPDPPIACALAAEETEPGLDWDRWLGPAPARAFHSDLSPRGVHNHYPKWRWYREYGNGYLADMGAHHYDIAHWALGMDGSGPIEARPAADGNATRGATLHYANGVTITHGGPSGSTFVGTEGMLHVDRGRTATVPADLMDKPKEAGWAAQARPANHFENWLDCIESRARPVCDVEVGARTAAACQLAALAYRLGEPVGWDPQAWRFTNSAHEKWMDYDRREGWGLVR